jgi:hypothetical protein
VVSCAPSGQEAAVEISFFGSLACEAEVNLLQALQGGVPGGACIGVGAGTVAVVALFLAVESLVILWIVRRARASRATPAPADPGPIWSARAGRDGGPIR